MGDLDGFLVGGDQAGIDEVSEHRTGCDGPLALFGAAEFGKGDPSPTVRGAFPEGDQSQQHAFSVAWRAGSSLLQTLSAAWATASSIPQWPDIRLRSAADLLRCATSGRTAPVGITSIARGHRQSDTCLTLSTC